MGWWSAAAPASDAAGSMALASVCPSVVSGRSPPDFMSGMARVAGAPIRGGPEGSLSTEIAEAGWSGSVVGAAGGETAGEGIPRSGADTPVDAITMSLESHATSAPRHAKTIAVVIFRFISILLHRGAAGLQCADIAHLRRGLQTQRLRSALGFMHALESSTPRRRDPTRSVHVEHS